MKVLFIASLTFFLAGCYARSAVAIAAPPVAVSVDTFAPYLDPYGAWVTVPGYSQQLWQPNPNYVGSDFYPYGTAGQWMYTNAGWVFESDYPFGWAVFHYGRWTRNVDYGWLWLPGTTWGPSWVSWRFGGPYVGWAPLGPYGPAGYQYADWCFVPAAQFTVYNSRSYATGPHEFHHAVATTLPARGVGIAGPPPSVISHATGAPVAPRPVNTLYGAGRTPPPPPPAGMATPGGPMQAPRPPPPIGWRQQPNQNPGQFTAPPQQLRTPPPAQGLNAPPPQGFVAPHPQYRSFAPAEPQNRGPTPPPQQSRPAPPPGASSSQPPQQSRPAPPPPGSQGFTPPPQQFRTAPQFGTPPPPPSQPSYRNAPPQQFRSAPPTNVAPPPPAPSRPSAPAPSAPPSKTRAAPPPPPSSPR